MAAANTTIVGILGADNAREDESPHHVVTFTQVIRLLDPSGEDERLYLLSTDKPRATAMAAGGGSSSSSSSFGRGAQVYELTHVLSDDDDHDMSVGGTGYTSMFVGNYVVNKPLHTFTPVDPLFWVLSKFDPPETVQSRQNEPPQQQQQQQGKWQPLNQIVAALNLALPEPIVEELSRPRTCGSRRRFRQMDHLFKRMNIGGGDDNEDDDSSEDEVFYKFCPDRAVRWLKQKQERVESVMISIAMERKQQCGSDEDRLSGGGTAFDSGFCFSSEDDPAENMENHGSAGSLKANANNGTNEDAAMEKSASEPTMLLDSAAMQRANDESVQVVCQYLTPAWRDALLRSMDLARSSLEGKTQSSSSSSKSQAGIHSGAKSSSSSSSGLPAPHLSIEEQLLGAGVGPAATSKKPAPSSNKKSKIKPSDSKGMKKMTSFFTKK
jgi:hypothetical protein